MTNQLVISEDRQTIVGAAFDVSAAESVFADYHSRKSANTLRRQRADLAVFVNYLVHAQFLVLGDEQTDAERKAFTEAFQTDADAWRYITYGLIAGFPRWMLQQGYAIGSVNVRLVTVKLYTEMAFTAGVIPDERASRIRTVKAYAHKEKANVDQNRLAENTPIRVGHKKAKATPINPDERKQLKAHPDTPQGRRDALLMCLLLDHGLRCGEIAALETTAFNLKSGKLTFYRKKVKKEQTHKLTRDAWAAARAYFKADAPLSGRVLLGSAKGGKLTDKPMTERAITKRVEYLGRKIGLLHLSAHDGRHSWATTAARNKTDPFALQEAGGWNSLAMPRRYIEEAKIANENVDLGEG